MAIRTALFPLSLNFLQLNSFKCCDAATIHTSSSIRPFLDVLLRNKPQFDVQRRFLPKPVKAVQYKHDFRVLENKPYTADPLYVPSMQGKDPKTGFRHNERVKRGVPFDYFWKTAYPHRPSEGNFYEEKVLEIRCDPNHSAHMALLAGSRGRRWTFALDGWKAGDIIRITNQIPDIPFTPKQNEIWPVGAMATGTQVCVVEALPNAQNLSELRAAVAGSSATILGRRGDRVLVKLPGQREILVDRHCYASVGRVSNVDWASLNWGSMNMKRRLGIKQGSGLYHKKDGYCGRKVKAPQPPLLPERRGPAQPRYQFSLSAQQTHCGFGTHELNQVLAGAYEW